MTVHLRLAIGIARHFPARVNEWIMTYPLMGWSAVLRADEQMFDKSASFSELARWGDESTWALICLLAGFVRLMSLVVNGTFTQFTYAPHLRMVASIVAAVFWAQITLGVLVAWAMSGGIASGIIAYSTFMMLEMFNVYRASKDVGALRSAG